MIAEAGRWLRRTSGLSSDEPTWRVGHRGRDNIYYEERHRRRWRRIEISGEMLTGRAHHVIYLPGPEHWRAYPDWARDRRDEIVGRIRSEFRAPDYEYYDGDGGPVPVRRPAGDARALRLSGATTSQRGALVVAIAVLIAIAVGAGWMVVRGIRTGTTVLPVQRATLQRPVSRDREPITFWFAIGVLGLAATGAGGLALLAVREGLRSSDGAS